MTSDTAKRLAEIEAREAKATPGPWVFDTLPHPYGERPRIYGDGTLIAVMGNADMSEDSQRRWEDNTWFIARGRSDIPWLLAQIKAAQERVQAAERERDELKKTIARLEGRMCLICGAPEPCELDKEEMSPCTFDPSPIEAAQRFQRERNEARDALAFYAAPDTYEQVDLLGRCPLSTDRNEDGDYGMRARKALGGQS